MRCIRTILLPTALAGTLLLTGCPSDNTTNAGPAHSSDTSLTSPPSNPTVNVPPTPQTASPQDDVVATVSGVDITRKQLDEPLIEAYGLDMLMKLVQLELAKQEANREHITVSPQDIADETQKYIDNVFRDDKRILELRDQLDQSVHDNKLTEAEKLRGDLRAEQQRLLNQLLDQQHITHTDFTIAMQTRTYLRRIVQPAVQKQLTEENLQERFKARYGERVRIRRIAVANVQEMNEVKRRLADGQSFQQVAMDLSRDRATAALGGEMQPFSRFAPYPQVFLDLAFGLKKPSEISESLEVDGSYQILQLIDRIAPTAVKFEDVKDSVRQDLQDGLTDAAETQIRNTLGAAALKEIQIHNPTLAKQFDDKVTQRNNDIRDKEQIRRELKLQRTPATAPAAATEPASKATATPATTGSATQH